jgi:hypothetical protein
MRKGRKRKAYTREQFLEETKPKPIVTRDKLGRRQINRDIFNLPVREEDEIYWRDLFAKNSTKENTVLSPCFT